MSKISSLTSHVSRLTFHILCLTSYAFLLTGCDIKDNEVAADTGFLKIYDDNLFDASYIPLDIQQASDGGYLILYGSRIQSSDFVGVRILRVDEEGNFLNDFKMEPNYVHPTYNLMKVGKSYFFFCMDAVSLQTNLAKVMDDGTIAKVIPVGNVYYPLYASLSNNNKFILQSYDNNNKQSVLSVIGTDGTVIKRQGFGIGAGVEVEKPIIEHFTRTGKQLPFLVGQASNGLYYFNGFFNYTFSLVFTNLNDGEPLGVAQGQHDDGGISALLPLEGGNFAISRFNFGENYILPNAAIDPWDISSSIDMAGFAIPELQPDAKVIVERITVNGTNIILYGSNTKNGQIILMAYDELTGTLKGIKYLGFSYPYEIAGFVQTQDEGLAVAALTYVAGRFPRICLFKLSKVELAGIVGA